MGKPDLSIPRIASIKDPLVLEARELHSAANRIRLGKCLLEGKEAIEWALQAGAAVECVFVEEKSSADPFVDSLKAQNVACYAVSSGIAQKITGVTYVVPFTGLAKTERKKTGKGDFVVLLDRLQDAGNIGTIVRTATAFGVRDIYAASPDADIFFKKTIDASRGKVFEVNFERFASGVEAVRFLKQAGYQVIATSSHAPVLQALAPIQNKPLALVLGNETSGVSDDVLALADLQVQIPMSGTVESLNVGVAAGISLYELKIRMVMTMLTRLIRATLGRQVNVTGRLVQAVFNAKLAKVSSLNGLQVILLMMVQCDRILAVEQASRELGIYSDEMEGLLAPLYEQRLLERAEADGAAAMRLTAEGEQTLGRLWLVVEQSENEMLAGFTDEEKRQFDTLMQRIQENCIHILG